jgi:hypothetical protein
VASGRRVTESSAAEAGFCEYLNVGARSSDPLKKRKSKKKSKKEEKKRKKEKRENREKGKRRTDPSFAQTTQRMGHPQVFVIMDWKGACRIAMQWMAAHIVVALKSRTG